MKSKRPATGGDQQFDPSIGVAPAPQIYLPGAFHPTEKEENK
jgi:hypothetical protein